MIILFSRYVFSNFTTLELEIVFPPPQNLTNFGGHHMVFEQISRYLIKSSPHKRRHRWYR